MTALAEWSVSAIALIGMLPLTLGLVALVRAGDAQVKVHALSVAGIGPLFLLLAAPIWGDVRTILTALVLLAALLVTTAVSGHAIMRLVAAREESRPQRPADAEDPQDEISGEGR